MKIINFLFFIVISLISIILARNSSKDADKYNPGGGIQRDYTKNVEKFKPTKHSKYEKQIMSRNLLKKRKNKRRSL